MLTYVYVPVAMAWPHEETQNSLSWQPLLGVALPWVFFIHHLQTPRPADGTWHQRALSVLLLCHPFRITQASEVLQVSWALFWRKQHLKSTRIAFSSKSVQLFWGFQGSDQEFSQGPPGPSYVLSSKTGWFCLINVAFTDKKSNLSEELPRKQVGTADTSRLFSPITTVDLILSRSSEPWRTSGGSPRRSEVPKPQQVADPWNADFIARPFCLPRREDKPYHSRVTSPLLQEKSTREHAHLSFLRTGEDPRRQRFQVGLSEVITQSAKIFG